MARPIVNTDIGSPEAIRPTARPLGSVARPAQMGASPAMQLASALSEINPRLQGFVAELGQDYQEAEEGRAYDSIQGMTFEQAQEAVQSGQLRETESPWYQAAFEKQFGMAYAGRRRREILDAYNNEFDKHNGDLDTFLAQYASGDRERFGGSEFIMSGLRAGMGDLYPKLKDQHAEFTSGVTKERVADNFGSIARNAITQAMEDGNDPMEAVRSVYKDHKTTFGMTFKELDNSVFNLVKEYAAAGDVDTVEALLNYEAVGEDGTKVGSFLTRQTYSLEAQALLEEAKAKRGEENRKENTQSVVGLRQRGASGTLTDGDRITLQALKDNEQISQREHESILLQHDNALNDRKAKAYLKNAGDELHQRALEAVLTGNAAGVRDVTLVDPATGSAKTWTADDLRETAVTDAMDALAADEVPPPQMAAHLASWGVAETYAPWEYAMTNGYTALTDSLAVTGENGRTEIPEAAMKGYVTYKALAEQPRVRDRHIKDQDAASIYRDAEVLESLGLATAEEALLRSASIDRKGGTARANALGRNEIEDIVDAVDGGMFSSGYANASRVAETIEDAVNVQIALGVPKKTAVKNGIKAFEDSHTVINGYPVNTKNVHIPPNFETAGEILIERFAEENGYDADDISLWPVNEDSNYWIVVPKGGLPIPMPTKGSPNRLHLNSIMRVYEEDRLDAVNEQVRENVK